jgi:REP element-mobilizing transposase RayT
MHLIHALITWTCYGQWLHGTERGSVDPEHNVPDTPFLPTDPDREASEREHMTQPAYEMDAPRRRVVLTAIRDVCLHRGWTLHAAHVRARHVHVVVSGMQTPERMMNDFKAYVSRALNAAGFDTPTRKRWTRHGSTKYINDESYLAAAVNYVLEEQGQNMERWPEETLPNGRGS